MKRTLLSAVFLLLLILILILILIRAHPVRPEVQKQQQDLEQEESAVAQGRVIFAELSPNSRSPSRDNLAPSGITRRPVGRITI